MRTIYFIAFRTKRKAGDPHQPVFPAIWSSMHDALVRVSPVQTLIIPPSLKVSLAKAS